MKVTYIHHSCFLVETDCCYYLFDYEKGTFPALNTEKPIYVFSSHGHHDHYQEKIFSILKDLGMQSIFGILSDDIACPPEAAHLSVSPGRSYTLPLGQTLTTLKSTDLGVAFLLEEQGLLIYHAGDLNDWVWEEESASYNEQMTLDYRKQIDLLSQKLAGRKIHLAFVVLDPRQEKDYAIGMRYFLENIHAEQVFPMHYWGNPGIIQTFLQEHPEYQTQISMTE